jgi:hypothetical protein
VTKTRTLDDVRAEIRDISEQLRQIEPLHRRRRALYLEAKTLGASTKLLAEDADCTKEAVVLQLRRGRLEADDDS